MAAGDLRKVGREAGVKELHDKVDLPCGERGATAGMKAGSILDEWRMRKRLGQRDGGVVRAGFSLRSDMDAAMSRGEYEDIAVRRDIGSVM